VSTLAFGEKGALLAAGDDDGNVYLWDVSHRRLLGALAGSPARAATNTDKVAFSPDGGLVAASFDDGTVGLWSAATGRRLAVLPDASTSPTDPVTFGLDGRVLLDLNPDGDLTQWQLDP
jgi:WD40 repeat protein